MLPPTILVIFGITGDLSRRYLLPAVSAIKAADRLPSDFKILGISRKDIQPEDILNDQTSGLGGHTDTLQMDTKNADDYAKLNKRIEKISSTMSTEAQVIFYLTIPPSAVNQVIKRLGEAGLNTENMKLMLEKPFGTDYESARQLVGETSKYFKEAQIYRIDHYLAKEVAQNIVVFLGSNTLFRDVWSGDFIEGIEIVASEQIGIEGRTGLWESTGSLRDFVQSHLLQLAALTLMEPCQDVFNLEQVAAHRLKALSCITPAKPSAVLAAQYESYKSEAENPNSTSETFISLSLSSNDLRWRDVPIKLVTGKKLNEKLTEIRIRFKKSHEAQSNLLVLRIQPKEGIELDLWIKQPGYERNLQKLSLNFSYDQHFGRLPDAYEQVLLDAMLGSHGLFASSEEVLTSWKILQPVLDSWQQNKEVLVYKDGSSASEVLKSAER